MWFKSSGKYRYNPKGLGDSGGEWWLVVDCDPGITEYYRKLYTMWVTGRPKLIPELSGKLIQAPFWRAHISIVKRDEPPDDRKHLWHKYAGQTVEFLYSNEMGRYGPYWACNVICEHASDVREELGLPREPWNPFHITIGNTKNLD